MVTVRTLRDDVRDVPLCELDVDSGVGLTAPVGTLR
jgi:hypothetical protein